MKKRIQIILLITLMLMFVGCGSSDTNSSSDTSSSSRTRAHQRASYDSSSRESSSESPSPRPIEEVVAPKPTNFKINYIGSFSTEDLDGNTVTEEIFANKEYTLINIWGTYCGPCINEMPELQEINDSLPDNFQVIGIVCNVSPGYQNYKADAEHIISTTGVTYTNLMVCEDMDGWMADVSCVPTTIIVDSEGNVVTEIIEGADISAYKDVIRKFGN